MKAQAPKRSTTAGRFCGVPDECANIMKMLSETPRFLIVRSLKDYRATVWERIKHDTEFARALYAAALDALLTGETAEGLSMLRDVVHAETTFKELARHTGYDEKSLHRMLSRRGNPTARTLAKIVAAIRADLGYVPGVSVATA